LNDLWRFNGTNWVWVSGTNILNHLGVYIKKGGKYPNSVPRGKINPSSWIDSLNNLYLFGGDSQAGPDGIYSLINY
jgi:hypothetical protein